MSCQALKWLIRSLLHASGIGKWGGQPDSKGLAKEVVVMLATTTNLMGCFLLSLRSIWHKMFNLSCFHGPSLAINKSALQRT